MTDETETARAPDLAGAVPDLLALIRLMADPKAAQRQLDAFVAGSSRIKDERSAADRAFRERAAQLDEREAEVAKLEKAISAQAGEYVARKADIDRKAARINEIFENICEKEAQIKREIIRFSGGAIDERIQALPDWSQLARDVFGISDVHYDDGSESHGRPETSDELEPAPGRQEGSTLTHRSPRPRRSETVRGTA